MSNLLGRTASSIEVKNEGEGTLLAPGLHPAIIQRIEEGLTDNDVAYVDYHFAINGGVNNGANIRSREWPDAKSEIGQDIYNKKLKALLKICGLGDDDPLQSLTQLCGVQMLINNKPFSPKDDPTKVYNGINYYRSYDPSLPLAQAAPAAAAPVPAVRPAPAPVPAPAPMPAPAPQPVHAAPPQPVHAAPAPAPAPVPPMAITPPVMATPAPQPGTVVAQAPVAAPQPVMAAPAPQPGTVVAPVAPPPAPAPAAPGVDPDDALPF